MLDHRYSGQDAQLKILLVLSELHGLEGIIKWTPPCCYACVKCFVVFSKRKASIHGGRVVYDPTYSILKRSEKSLREIPTIIKIVSHPSSWIINSSLKVEVDGTSCWGLKTIWQMMPMTYTKLWRSMAAKLVQLLQLKFLDVPDFCHVVLLKVGMFGWLFL